MQVSCCRDGLDNTTPAGRVCASLVCQKHGCARPLWQPILQQAVYSSAHCTDCWFDACAWCAQVGTASWSGSRRSLCARRSCCLHGTDPYCPTAQPCWCVIQTMCMTERWLPSIAVTATAAIVQLYLTCVVHTLFLCYERLSLQITVGPACKPHLLLENLTPYVVCDVVLFLQGVEGELRRVHVEQDALEKQMDLVETHQKVQHTAKLLRHSLIQHTTRSLICATTHHNDHATMLVTFWLSLRTSGFCCCPGSAC